MRRFGWRLVILDYLGLLAATESDRSEFQTDLLNSAALRRIARRNDIALLIIAGLRKAGAVKKKEDRPINLDDVSGAGRITYDASSVWLVDSTQETTASGRPAGFVTLTPLKLRFSGHGRDDKVTLRWEPGYGAISDD